MDETRCFAHDKPRQRWLWWATGRSLKSLCLGAREQGPPLGCGCRALAGWTGSASRWLDSRSWPQAISACSCLSARFHRLPQGARKLRTSPKPQRYLCNLAISSNLSWMLDIAPIMIGSNSRPPPSIIIFAASLHGSAGL